MTVGRCDSGGGQIILQHIYVISEAKSNRYDRSGSHSA